MTTLFDGFRATFDRRPADDKYRVLIAEDYVELANVIAMLLRHCGFDVQTANDGRVVLATARTFLPHFILLDINLPGLGGYRVAELLREDTTLGRPVIIGISAYRPAIRPDSPMNVHFDHYLKKPFDLESLLALLKPIRPTGNREIDP